MNRYVTPGPEHAIGVMMLPAEIAQTYWEIYRRGETLCSNYFQSDEHRKGTYFIQKAWVMIWESFPQLQPYCLQIHKNPDRVYWFEPKILIELNKEDDQEFHHLYKTRSEAENNAPHYPAYKECLLNYRKKNG
jgi:hypothetical protein